MRKPQDQARRRTVIRATEREQGLIARRPNEPQRVRTDGRRIDQAGLPVPSRHLIEPRRSRAGVTSQRRSRSQRNDRTAIPP